MNKFPYLPLLLAAGGLLPAAQLVNPAFETEQGWEKWRDGKQTERRLSEHGRNNSRCAFISAPAGEKGAYLQRIKNPQSGDYTLTCWYRTSLGKQCARLEVTGKRDGKAVFSRSAALPGSRAWHTGSLAFQLPAGITELIVTLFVADGKAWFDDLALQAAPPAASPVELPLEGIWKFHPGDLAGAAAPEFDDSGWDNIKVPALWEKEGYPELEGFAWYRRRIELPPALRGRNLVLIAGGISKADETFFDGVKIGSTGQFSPKFKGDTFGMRRYLIPARLTGGAAHTIAVRAHDGASRQSGGIWIAPVRLRPAEVREFRRVTLDTGKTANLFAPGEPVTLKLSADDLSGARLDRPELRGTVRRYDRTVAAEFRLKLPQPAGHAEAVETLPPLPEGFYTLETELTSSDGLTARHGFTFGVLPEQPEPAEPRFGLAGHLNRLDDDELVRTLAVARRIGIGTFRTGFLWKDAEPEPGRWNWSRFDRTVKALRDSGMELTATLAGTPDWASTDPLGRRGLPRKAGRMPQLDRWQEYARRIAQRYAGNGISWELWNEPNLKSYWKPAPESHQYFQLQQAGYRGVKAGDPNATVLTAGFSPFRFVEPDATAELFLDDLYEYAGQEKVFDRIAYHPYPVMRKAITNASLEQQFTEMMRRLRAVRDRRGDRSGFRLTELGAPNLPRTVDERRQAEILTLLLTLCTADPGIEQVHWYNFQNDGDNPDYAEHNFGLVHHDLSPKPALFAFRHLLRMLSRADYQERIEENGIVFHRFTAGGAPLLVAWSDTPTNWTLPPGVAAVTGVTGEPLHPADGRLTIGTAPVYLQFTKGN